MASPRHQFILGFLIQKMRIAGFKIFFVDGQFIGEKNDIKIPPKIIRHRPDAMGIDINGRVCIADAKLNTDLHSKRTKEQIMDYTSVLLNNMPCKVFLGIPREADDYLANLLKKLYLDNYPNIYVLKVPSNFLDGKNKTKFLSKNTSS